MVGAVVAAAIVAVKTLAPVLHATDQMIFRDALVNMRGGRSYYPAMRDALAGNDAAATQVRSFRLPTEFLLLRWFPPATHRWLAAAAVLLAVALCWRLARDAHPAVQAAVLVGASLWLSTLLDAVYLYAEIWAVPAFLLGLLAIRRERWVLAALALTLATCTRELYLPALLAATVVAPRGHRRPFLLGSGVVAAVAAVHYALASGQLVPDGNEAPFSRLGSPTTIIETLLAPRATLGVLVPVGLMTVLDAIGITRTCRRDRAALVAGISTVTLVVATIFGGRVYWPLMYGASVVAFAGGAFVPDAPRVDPAPNRTLERSLDAVDRRASWLFAVLPISIAPPRGDPRKQGDRSLLPRVKIRQG